MKLNYSRFNKVDKYFKCDKIVCERHAEDIESEEDDYMMVGFSDNGDDPREYVILQKAYYIDRQDRELGMDGCYMEFVSTDCEVVGYDLCREIYRDDKEIIFRFKENPDDVDELRIDISGIQDIPNDFKDTFKEIISPLHFS